MLDEKQLLLHSQIGNEYFIFIPLIIANKNCFSYADALNTMGMSFTHKVALIFSLRFTTRHSVAAITQVHRSLAKQVFECNSSGRISNIKGWSCCKKKGGALTYNSVDVVVIWQPMSSKINDNDRLETNSVLFAFFFRRCFVVLYWYGKCLE